MQFSAIFLTLGAFATLAAARTIVVPPFGDSCSVLGCLEALAPSIAACATAAAQEGIDPVSDAACFTAAVGAAGTAPAACSGCF